jgi:cyclic pyranopterin phosphate synthase
MADFSHFNEDGRATMVDVGGKNVTERVAVAVGRILVNEECYNMIKTGGHKKGDVRGTAQIAGIMAAKKTPDIIPMCHPIMITGANIRFNLNDEDLAVEIEATVKCSGVTGVEMEALTAASAAALTIYDMCKAVQKDMVIDQIHLVSKSGGKSGDFVWGGDK